jgi:quinone-modifying oxidoreductase subunit QmoA
MEVDLAVLATGMVPNTVDDPPPLETTLDEYGFIASDTDGGVIGAGVAVRPLDVSSSIQDATGAALKAINVGMRR